MSDMAFQENEKFALIAISTGAADIPTGTHQVSDTMWIATQPPFELSTFWTETLGQSRKEDFDNASLYLFTKLFSKAPAVLDGENQALHATIGRTWTALKLCARFQCSQEPMFVTGTMTNRGPEARQVSIEQASLTLPRHVDDSIDLPVLGKAAEMGYAFRALGEGSKHNRLFRTLRIYQDGIAERDILDQLHQAARCVEGLLIAEPGKSQARFKSRTELFVGPHCHDVMEDIYQLRSAVEHVNDHLHLESWSRERRIDILQKAIFIGYVAQTALLRIFDSPELLRHFIDDDAIKGFWKMSSERREQIWGPPIDLPQAYQRLDTRYISDSDLGL